ncbi:hypothetical protein GCM10009687_41760 [Asanoa iriomotensis]|uniref:Membrane-associated oxidoreductase n=2 Tax=Asanoa iriomotensis TaxID=234613 RepID=A0ABQ4C3U9_9ACTN|nr:hypothetical protein Air01nite_35270 [Asanoa iriomotensis]
MNQVAPVTQFDPRRDAKEQLLEASLNRRVLDCRSAGQRHRLAADDIRSACLQADNLDPFGLRVAHASIDGALDLRGTQIKVGLWFTSCVFAQPVRLDGAELHELVIADDLGDRPFVGSPYRSELPGLLANGVRIRRDLILSGTVITGAHRTSASLTRSSAIWLTEADIGGRLLAIGTTINATGDRAIQADRTRVGGDVRLVRGFTATGEVRLLAVQLNGSLDLTASSFLPRDGRALDIAEASIGGSLFLLDDPDLNLRPRIHGRLELGRTTIGGRLHIRNADLRAPARGVGLHDYNNVETYGQVAILGQGLAVAGTTRIEGDTIIRGAVALHGADLKGGLHVGHAEIWNPGDIALDLAQATIGAGVAAPGLSLQGTAQLANATIRGPLNLDDAELSHPYDRRCVVAVGARIDGDVTLRRAKASTGYLNLRGSSIAGVLDAQGAILDNPGDKTINLHQARVAGSVRLCAGFSSSGLVVLNRATIDGRLRCGDGTFAWSRTAPTVPGSEPNPRNSAFEAISAVVRGGIDLRWRVTAGAVDFTNAQTSFLADDPATDWPPETYLGGFVYESFAPTDWRRGHGEWDPDVRARWLATLTPDDPQPWKQVARVLRANGNPSGAERVLIAQRRHARRRLVAKHGWRGRTLLDLLADATVRYGHRPHRAILAVIGLIAAVAITLTPATARSWMVTTRPAQTATIIDANYARTAAARSPCSAAGACFQPILYAIDTVIPILDLKQRSAWQPSRHVAWLQLGLDAAAILGWIAFTVFALSFTRLGRQ